jgi:hypothetical protein
MTGMETGRIGGRRAATTIGARKGIGEAKSDGGQFERRRQPFAIIDDGTEGPKLTIREGECKPIKISSEI